MTNPKTKNETCECGHEKEEHYIDEPFECDLISCPCKKFKSQSVLNEDWASIPKGDKPINVLRGIFSTEDLEKEIKEGEEEQRTNKNRITELAQIIRNTRLQERTRLKAEVSKILDDEYNKYYNDEESDFDDLDSDSLDLVYTKIKKRLGI